MKPLLPKLLVAAASFCIAGTALAQDKVSDGVVKVGLLLDMSGPYADINGPGSALAARMAVEDFGGKVLDKPVEVMVADHQNKADVASSLAQKWFDVDKLDAITDVAASATALAVINVGKTKNKLVLVSGAAGGTSRITNEDCSDISVHWTYNTHTLANVIGSAIVKQGRDDWYFVTADYAFGHSLEKDTSDVVKAAGGKVLGSVRHPLNTSDFSSFMLQAQSSGASVIGLANAGLDTVNAIKTANEFGIMMSGKQSVAGLLMYISDIHSLGLPVTQNMLLSESFYWDLNDETRAWSKRFFEQHKRMPTSAQVGAYSSVTHYLKAVQAAGTDETKAVMAKMRELPVNDFSVKDGKVRIDSTMVHPMYVMQVKTPSESKYPWDYYTVRSTVPADEAFPSLANSKCPLAKQ